MEPRIDRTAAIVPDTIEREMSLVREAILLVAAGEATRVVVGALRLGDALLPQARQMAAEAGVRIVPLWTADEAGVDIAIERVRE